jgi:hypothetical protein
MEHLMLHSRTFVALALFGILASPNLANSDDTAIDSMRSRLAELGRAVIEEAEGLTPKQEGPPYKRTPSEEGLYQLSRAPREPVRRAIDQALKNGTKEERIGALTLYDWIVDSRGSYFPSEPLNPSYRDLLFDLLSKDDRTLPAYTGALTGALWLYPMSRETVLVYMDIAEHASNPKTREDYLLVTASVLGLNLPIYKQTPPLEKERILADFEAWFAKNKNQIAFDEKGRSVLAGSKVPSRRQALHAEDRARIRQGPVCVLQLMQASIGGPSPEDTATALIKKCGEALYGTEAASLLTQAMETSKDGAAPSLDLQFALSRAQGKYPVTDAVLLAVAYVAAYDSDPANRELAKTSLDQFGSPDIPRVLKGEPKVVHDKMEQLADEALKQPEK